ncbi:MAG: hypothetical protein JWP89_6540 [Schlesneria sp.]|nr:hypothetical protein [Schlesneria sp.]
MRISSGYFQYVAMLLLAASPVAAVAEDQEQPKTAPEKQADLKADEAKGKEGSLLDKLSKELFKDLDEGQTKKPEKDNKLERAANGMRDAGDKLNENQTGQDTRKVQEQVIRDLDELIKQMQNPPPPPQGQGGGGGGGGSSGGASGKGSQSQMQKPGGGQGQSQQGQSRQMSGQGKAGKAGQGQQGTESSKSGSQEKKVAEGSDERTESERKASEEAARKKKLEMDVWGHLPPHLRDQLLNTYGEKVLPKYQHLVKQFYEALSEQGDTGPRR